MGNIICFPSRVIHWLQVRNPYFFLVFVPDPTLMLFKFKVQLDKDDGRRHPKRVVVKITFTREVNLQ